MGRERAGLGERDEKVDLDLRNVLFGFWGGEWASLS